MKKNKLTNNYFLKRNEQKSRFLSEAKGSYSLITNKLNSGQALVMLLMYMMIAIIVTSASVMLIIVNSRATDSLYQGSSAYDVAESGAETAMIKLLRDPSYAGETLTVGTGQAVVTVSGSNPKTIISKGTLNNFTRSIKVIVDTSNNTITATSWKEI